MNVHSAAQGRFRYNGLVIATLTAVLAGCGGVPLNGQETPVTPASTTSSASSSAATSQLPSLPRAGSGRGGYYMDDGPGDAPPQNLLALPDAVPRIEPIGKRGNSRYVVFGKTYVPFTDDRPYKERGRGSWYGKKFHGQKTSSGESYDMYKMTAAHPTMPLPSYARVTNLENGRQVIVRVNDRGPFLAGRIIDLSYTAALKLGYLEKGSAMLEVERLLPDDIRRMAPDGAPSTITASGGGAAEMDTATAGGVETEAVAQQEMPQRAALPAAAVTQASMESAPLENAATVTATAAGIYLQLGAFGQAANAQAARHRYAQYPGVALPQVEVVEQGTVYRVFSGPFASRAHAEAVAEQLRRNEAFTPLIVQR